MFKVNSTETEHCPEIEYTDADAELLCIAERYKILHKIVRNELERCKDKAFIDKDILVAVMEVLDA